MITSFPEPPTREGHQQTLKDKLDEVATDAIANNQSESLTRDQNSLLATRAKTLGGLASARTTALAMDLNTRSFARYSTTAKQTLGRIGAFGHTSGTSKKKGLPGDRIEDLDLEDVPEEDGDGGLASPSSRGGPRASGRRASVSGRTADGTSSRRGVPATPASLTGAARRASLAMESVTGDGKPPGTAGGEGAGDAAGAGGPPGTAGDGHPPATPGLGDGKRAAEDGGIREEAGGEDEEGDYYEEEDSAAAPKPRSPTMMEKAIASLAAHTADKKAAREAALLKRLDKTRALEAQLKAAQSEVMSRCLDSFAFDPYAHLRAGAIDSDGALVPADPAVASRYPPPPQAAITKSLPLPAALVLEYVATRASLPEGMSFSAFKRSFVRPLVADMLADCFWLVHTRCFTAAGPGASFAMEVLVQSLALANVQLLVDNTSLSFKLPSPPKPLPPSRTATAEAAGGAAALTGRLGTAASSPRAGTSSIVSGLASPAGGGFTVATPASPAQTSGRAQSAFGTPRAGAPGSTPLSPGGGASRGGTATADHAGRARAAAEAQEAAREAARASGVRAGALLKQPGALGGHAALKGAQFFELFPYLMAEAVWTLYSYGVPGSRPSFNTKVQLEVQLLVVRTLCSIEVAPATVTRQMEKLFPDSNLPVPSLSAIGILPRAGGLNAMGLAATAANTIAVQGGQKLARRVHDGNPVNIERAAIGAHRERLRSGDISFGTPPPSSGGPRVSGRRSSQPGSVVPGGGGAHGGGAHGAGVQAGATGEDAALNVDTRMHSDRSLVAISRALGYRSVYELYKTTGWTDRDMLGAIEAFHVETHRQLERGSLLPAMAYASLGVGLGGGPAAGGSSSSAAHGASATGPAGSQALSEAAATGTVTPAALGTAAAQAMAETQKKGRPSSSTALGAFMKSLKTFRAVEEAKAARVMKASKGGKAEEEEEEEEEEDELDRELTAEIVKLNLEKTVATGLSRAISKELVVLGPAGGAPSVIPGVCGPPVSLLPPARGDGPSRQAVIPPPPGVENDSWCHLHGMRPQSRPKSAARRASPAPSPGASPALKPGGLVTTLGHTMPKLQLGATAGGDGASSTATAAPAATPAKPAAAAGAAEGKAASPADAAAAPAPASSSNKDDKEDDDDDPTKLALPPPPPVVLVPKAAGPAGKLAGPAPTPPQGNTPAAPGGGGGAIHRHSNKRGPAFSKMFTVKPPEASSAAVGPGAAVPLRMPADLAASAGVEPGSDDEDRDLYYEDEGGRFHELDARDDGLYMGGPGQLADAIAPPPAVDLMAEALAVAQARVAVRMAERGETAPSAVGPAAGIRAAAVAHKSVASAAAATAARSAARKGVANNLAAGGTGPQIVKLGAGGAGQGRRRSLGSSGYARKLGRRGEAAPPPADPADDPDLRTAAHLYTNFDRPESDEEGLDSEGEGPRGPSRDEYLLHLEVASTSTFGGSLATAALRGGGGGSEGGSPSRQMRPGSAMSMRSYATYQSMFSSPDVGGGGGGGFSAEAMSVGGYSSLPSVIMPTARAETGQEVTTQRFAHHAAALGGTAALMAAEEDEAHLAELRARLAGGGVDETKLDAAALAQRRTQLKLEGTARQLALLGAPAPDGAGPNYLASLQPDDDGQRGPQKAAEEKPPQRYTLAQKRLAAVPLQAKVERYLVKQGRHAPLRAPLVYTAASSLLTRVDPYASNRTTANGGHKAVLQTVAVPWGRVGGVDTFHAHYEPPVSAADAKNAPAAVLRERIASEVSRLRAEGHEMDVSEAAQIRKKKAALAGMDPISLARESLLLHQDRAKLQARVAAAKAQKRRDAEAAGLAHQVEEDAPPA